MKNKPNGNFTLKPNPNRGTRSSSPKGSQKPAGGNSGKPNPNYVPPASVKK